MLSRHAVLGVAAAVLSLALLLPSFAAPRARAEAARGFQIIVHSSNPTTQMSAEAIASVFFKRTSRWSDDEVQKPVDLPLGSAVRDEVSRKILGRSVQAVRTYWLQRIFSGGQTPPLELPDDQAVIRYVARTPGAIGYIAAGLDPAPAKAIEVR